MRCWSRSPSGSGCDLRESDMLSRISGDEFLLLLNPDPERERSRGVSSTSILQRLKAPFFIDDSEIFASTSIGVSLYPEHGSSYDALRQNADIAMYRVKNDGKGAAAFFDASMEREALARMKVEQSLRLAILEKRFCCAFQSKVDIRTQDVRGIEALVRLRDDEGVIQAPGTFINLAVELGPDRRADPSGAGRDRQIDRPDQRDLRPRHHASASTSRPSRPATPNSCAPFAQALEATGFPAALHDRGDGRRLRRQDPFPGRRSCRSSASSASASRSTISASAIRRCRRSPTSPPTRSRSTAPSSPTSISARAARASCGRSNP